jgi:hypothetical protein
MYSYLLAGGLLANRRFLAALPTSLMAIVVSNTFVALAWARVFSAVM